MVGDKMRYDVRIDGHTVQVEKTFRSAEQAAAKMNAVLTLTDPSKHAIVVKDYGRADEQ